MSNVTPGMHPPFPRAWIGDIELLPQLAPNGRVVPDMWVLPGNRIRSTRQLLRIARDNNQPLSIKKE